MLPQKLSSAYFAKLLCDCNEWACHYHALKGVLCTRQPTAYMIVLAASPLWACPNHPNLLLMGLQQWGTILLIIYYPHVHIYQAYIFKVEKVKLKGKKKKKKESPPFWKNSGVNVFLRENQCEKGASEKVNQCEKVVSGIVDFFII